MSNETKTPDHLPPVPEGYVYAGLGEDLPEEYAGHPSAFCKGAGAWALTKCSRCRGYHYAAPTDSDLGRKILAERAATDWSDIPEWAVWKTQDADGQRWAHEVKPHPSEKDEFWIHRDRVEFVGHGQPNPNWRETLERRPESDDRPLEHKGDVEMVVISRFGDDTPGLIIPESVANQLSDEATGSIIYAARENGYRIDIDDHGIRGWKE